VRSHLPSSPPTAPASWPEIFADFEQHVLPGVTHWNHPGFFAYFATASISSMLALAAARERRPDLEIRQRGMAGRADVPTMRVYCSEHAHSSIDKAAIALGLGANNVVHIGSDAEYRMRVDALSDAIASDRARGMLPLAVVATVGTTSTTSIDPVPCRQSAVSTQSVMSQRFPRYTKYDLKWIRAGVSGGATLRQMRQAA
jgi:hypothetical protein